MNPAQQAELTEQVLATALDISGDTAEFRRRCVARITQDGAGTKYYDAATDTMLFETMDLSKLVTYTEEEILDVPNYAAMLYARGADRDMLESLVVCAFAAWDALNSIRALVAAGTTGSEGGTTYA